MPYIPESHLQYEVLPLSRERGTEVFLYPGELEEVDDLLWDAEHVGGGDDKRVCLLVPYGYASYEEYYDVLRDYARKHRGTFLERMLLGLIDRVKALNVKEDWSVVRYLGSESDGDPGSLAASLTPGRCYYWPCGKENPVYNGVIDDEELTAYLYPCDPACWEVVSDPTGMARRALAGDADTVSGWRLEPVDDPGIGGLVARGAKLKEQVLAGGYEREGWSNSDIDEISLSCPNCGTSYEFPAWTLLNAEEYPSVAGRLLEGRLFETECPCCHQTFGVPHPCLYLDPVHNACVYLVVNEQMKVGVLGMFRELDAEPGGGRPAR